MRKNKYETICLISTLSGVEYKVNTLSDSFRILQCCLESYKSNKLE